MTKKGQSSFTTTETVAWRRSSHSGGGGNGDNCVEAAHIPSNIALRDSKHPNETLTISHTEWPAFLVAVAK